MWNKGQICESYNLSKNPQMSGPRLVHAGLCWFMLVHAGLCWFMLVYAGSCWFAGISSCCFAWQWSGWVYTSTNQHNPRVKCSSVLPPPPLVSCRLSSSSGVSPPAPACGAGSSGPPRTGRAAPSDAARSSAGSSPSQRVSSARCPAPAPAPWPERLQRPETRHRLGSRTRTRSNCDDKLWTFFTANRLN